MTSRSIFYNLVAVAGSQYTESSIRQCLLTLAKHAGNSVRAAEELNAAGIPVGARTLRGWREGIHADLYRQLHETYGREIEHALVPEFREAAIAGAAAARLAIDKAVRQIETDQVRDTAGAARNLMVTAATAMDKVYLATDRPTAISETRDAREILLEIATRLGIVDRPAGIESESKTTDAATMLAARDPF